MGSRVVVLLDDDPLVRFAIEGLLSELGFNVVEAQGGAQGLSLLPGLSRLDLLVTDVLMPGMDGWTFAERVREALPNLPVLYVTGYYGDRARPVAGGRIVLKPFGARSFAKEVAALICG